MLFTAIRTCRMLIMIVLAANIAPRMDQMGSVSAHRTSRMLFRAVTFSFAYVAGFIGIVICFVGVYRTIIGYVIFASAGKAGYFVIVVLVVAHGTGLVFMIVLTADGAGRMCRMIFTATYIAGFLFAACAQC